MQVQTISGMVTFAMITATKYSKENYFLAVFNSEHHMTLKRSLPRFLSAFEVILRQFLSEEYQERTVRNQLTN